MKKMVIDRILTDKESVNFETEGSMILDALFEFVRDFVIENLTVLNLSRGSMRVKMIKAGALEYDKFRISGNAFKSNIEKIEKSLPDNYLKKSITAAKDIIEKVTQRNVLSKMPMPLINYLEKHEVNESEIDWVMKSIRENWIRFAGIYAHERISL